MAPGAIDCAPAAATAAPERPPSKQRPMSPGRLVRFGVEGSLSTTSSPSASKVKTVTATPDPIKANGEALRLSQCRFAAQATTAGAVIVRNPELTPLRNPRSSTYDGFMISCRPGR